MNAFQPEGLRKLLIDFSDSLIDLHKATNPAEFGTALQARNSAAMMKNFVTQRKALCRHIYLLSQLIEGDSPTQSEEDVA